MGKKLSWIQQYYQLGLPIVIADVANVTPDRCPYCAMLYNSRLGLETNGIKYWSYRCVNGHIWEQEVKGTDNQEVKLDQAGGGGLPF